MILEEFIEEKLDYLRNRPLLEEMFSVFIDAYHTELSEEGKMQSISKSINAGLEYMRLVLSGSEGMEHGGAAILHR